MAQQQIQFSETIRAMKLAMKRRPDDADSDDSIQANTNRGNKLKRKAGYVQHGQLNHSGSLAYKKKVDHAGYTRNIVSTNPPLFDEDGDRYSPDPSDRDAELYGEPLEENPFGKVQLETLLRPLVSAAELPFHPSLSIAYKSKALTQMAEDAFEMLRRERASLWKAKRLLQRFRGDADWVPCAIFEGENDETLLDAEGSTTEKSIVPSVATDLSFLYPGIDAGRQSENGPVSNTTHDQRELKEESTVEPDAMVGVEAVDMAAASTASLEAPEKYTDEIDGAPADRDSLAPRIDGQLQDKGNEESAPAAPADASDAAPEQARNQSITDLADREGASETASNSNGTTQHAMTTRARARSPAEQSDRTGSPSPSDSTSVPTIHPWFATPVSALVDRDLGLPAGEAEETRRILLLYVQKQEQIVRALDTLSSGLLKADRLRNFVHHSCKAEAHLVPDGKGNMVTEMSDGEDWYDVSDWNLQSWELRDGKLEKGKDEIEDVEEEGRRGPRRRRVNRM